MTDRSSLFDHVLVPVATSRDARATAEAVLPYLDGHGGRATVVHVVEKAGGAPDKASVEQREQEAQDIFAAFADGFADAGATYETEIRYGTDVAETIIEAAADVDASAIVFTPRGGGRWIRLLTGDVSLSLVTESDRPVVVLPDEADEDDRPSAAAETRATPPEEGDDS